MCELCVDFWGFAEQLKTRKVSGRRRRRRRRRLQRSCKVKTFEAWNEETFGVYDMSRLLKMFTRTDFGTYINVISVAECHSEVTMTSIWTTSKSFAPARGKLLIPLSRREYYWYSLGNFNASRILSQRIVYECDAEYALTRSSLIFLRTDFLPLELFPSKTNSMYWLACNCENFDARIVG